jgi:hypothetical protein
MRLRNDNGLLGQGCTKLPRTDDAKMQIARKPGGLVLAHDLQSRQPMLPAVHGEWFLFDFLVMRNRRARARSYLPTRTHSNKSTTEQR